MCGIVGILHKDRERLVSEPEIVAMRDLLVHRGPDDQGLFIDGNVGMGHRRLSIIDLSSGHQPMTNEDGSLYIVFNGEIYNFQDLRKDLLHKGHVFKTRSDTEVILHLYEEQGEDCPSVLNGIFAFAIWDRKKRSLFLARDHMGIKPLYYAETATAFLFASEMKSIVRSGYLDARCNEEVVPEYFIFRHVSGENTLFKGIKSLLPGYSIIVQNGTVRTREYWSPFPPEKDYTLSFNEATEKLSWLIQDSVKKQLISDVPLGTFCSGGVDSSLVTAMAARLVGSPINTFSVGFHENGYDETRYARTVSEQYGTSHHEVKLTNEEFADLLPRVIWHNDEPLNFANSIQIFAISKLAKEHVTVVLTGEGADELFGGYPRYLLPEMAQRCRKIPPWLRRLVGRTGKLFGDHRIEKIIKFAEYSTEETYLLNSSFLEKRFLLQMGESFPANGGFPYRESSLRKGEALSLDPVNCLSLLDQQNYLVSILNRQDKMSMAASIESRVPLLDYRIVEFANRLPARYKVQHFQTKRIVKKIAENYLPRSIIKRRKSGFGVPLAEWFREEKGLGGLVRDIVCDDRINDYFGTDRLPDLLNQHMDGVKDHSEYLWAATNFMLWKKIFKVS